MPKAVTEIRSLARSHTRTAINVLVGVMRHPQATPAARVAAANAILDRGWGKATQAIGNGNDGALELIHRIERVIVHPENPDKIPEPPRFPVPPIFSPLYRRGSDWAMWQPCGGTAQKILKSLAINNRELHEKRSRGPDDRRAFYLW